jgi:hypothetical protein
VNYRVHQKSTTHLSMAANRLDAEMQRRLAEAAPNLYGVSSETMQSLSQRKLPFAAPALKQIARHLGDEQTLWKSANFQHSARYLTAKTDLRTRAMIAFKAGGIASVLGESVNVLLDLARFIRDSIFKK